MSETSQGENHFCVECRTVIDFHIIYGNFMLPCSFIFLTSCIKVALL